MGKTASKWELTITYSTGAEVTVEYLAEGLNPYADVWMQPDTTVIHVVKAELKLLEANCTIVEDSFLVEGLRRYVP
jgi:hypothetical protein